MGKQMIKYGAVLIGLYVVVANGSNFGQVMSAGATGGSQLVKSLQGRG